MPRPTDEERAADVRAFYGLDEHFFDENFLDANGLDANGRKWVLSAPLLPVQRAPEGASDFEVRMRTWLPGLTKHGAGPLTAAALEEAGLPLKPGPNGKWKIDKDKAHKERDLVADDLDQQNADRVRKFYGLDGKSPALADWGCLPSGVAPKGATAFHKAMLERLHNLTRSDRSAGKWEKEALEAAGLSVIENKKGGYSIDREATRAAYRNRIHSSQSDGFSQGGAIPIAASVGSSSYPVSSSGWDPAALQNPAGRVGDFSRGGRLSGKPGASRAASPQQPGICGVLGTGGLRGTTVTAASRKVEQAQPEPEVATLGTAA